MFELIVIFMVGVLTGSLITICAISPWINRWQMDIMDHYEKLMKLQIPKDFNCSKCGRYIDYNEIGKMINPQFEDVGFKAKRLSLYSTVICNKCWDGAKLSTLDGD